MGERGIEGEKERRRGEREERRERRENKMASKLLK